MRIWAVSFAVLATVSIIGWTTLEERLTADAPALALRVMPFSARAVEANLLRDVNSAGSDVPVLDALLEPIIDAGARHPLSAGLRALRGEVLLRLDRWDEARTQFDHALQLNGAHALSLQRMAYLQIAEGDIDAAYAQLDRLRTRHPYQRDAIAQLAVALITSPGGADHVLRTYRADPAAMTWFIDHLRRTQQGLVTLPLLLRRALNEDGTPPSNAWIEHRNATLRVLIGERAYAEAEQFELFTRAALQSDGEATVAFVRNAALRERPADDGFDWTLRSNASVEASWIDPDNETATGPGIALRFLRKPLKGSPVSQFVRLPPGRYDFRATLDTQALQSAKPLELVIGCLEPSSIFAQWAVPLGTQTDVSIGGRFMVPATPCTLGQLRLRVAGSSLYKDAVSGDLTFRSFDMERVAP